MPGVWRIVKERRADDALSGEGAARFGGRWNSRGTRVIYASSTRSLALLETLVHLNPPVPFRFVFFHLLVPDDALETLSPLVLPPDWTAEPPAAATQRLGDAWVREGRSLALAVPSVLLPDESNFLINPAHPRFAEIRMPPPQPFTLDPRLQSRESRTPAP
jgi:RES domain-containing protein